MLLSKLLITGLILFAFICVYVLMNNHKGVCIEVPWREEEDATSPGLELEVAMSHETCAER